MPMYKPEAHGQLLKLSKVRQDHPSCSDLSVLIPAVAKVFKLQR